MSDDRFRDFEDSLCLAKSNLHPVLTASFPKFRERTKAGASSHSFLPLCVALHWTLAQLDARSFRVGVQVHQVLPLDM